MGRMGRPAVALVSGILFGLGLAVSGMIDPMKVKGFLDVAGAWDPSLIFVMGGAVAVSFVAFRLAARQVRPVLAPMFDMPTRGDVDARLIGGAAIFGVGWGLVGLCPGPAIAALAHGRLDTAVFAVAMAIGLAAAPFVGRRRSTAPAPAPHAPTG